MSRPTMPVTGVHADGTTCTHQVNQRTGLPKDPHSGCTGRTGYAATCSACGETVTNYLKLLVTPDVTSHLRQHKHSGGPATMTAPAGFATFYGLTIATCDEDAEAFVVLGHHDHRRIAAAANNLLRTERVERYRPGVGELPTIEHTFGVITESTRPTRTGRVAAGRWTSPARTRPAPGRSRSSPFPVLGTSSCLPSRAAAPTAPG